MAPNSDSKQNKSPDYSLEEEGSDKLAFPDLTLSPPQPDFPWAKGLFALAGIVCLILLVSKLFIEPESRQRSNLTSGFTIPVAATNRSAILTAEEKRDLLFMAEEEKLARDVYLYLHKRWKLSQFGSIARSEKQHVGAVVSLLQGYGLADPVTGSLAGQFQNSHLASLYQELISRGDRSSVEAMRVGGLIEEVDILDLEAAINRARQADIKQVYSRIQRGSFNHLRSFAHSLELVGEPYTPVKLSQDSFQSIINSPMLPGF